MSEVVFAITPCRAVFGFCVCWRNDNGVCVTYVYVESNRSQIACVMSLPERIGIEHLQNRIGSGLQESAHLWWAVAPSRLEETLIVVIAVKDVILLRISNLCLLSAESAS